MIVDSVRDTQNFEGNIILKNKISAQQRYLFNRHKPDLEVMIKDMPFDLYVEQSKSKKTIGLTTNVKDANTYVVRKNEQNFVEAARSAITDGMQKSEEYKKLVKSNEILNLLKLHMGYVIVGKFKEAREISKQIAPLGIKNFEIYRAMNNYEITDLPPELGKIILVNSLKYKIYRAFTPKSPEEKELYRMNKAYFKNLKERNIKFERKKISYRDINPYLY